MRFDLHPLRGANNLEFGMPNFQVRRLMDRPFSSFRRGGHTGTPDDYFDTAGLFAYYDDQGRLEALEFATPAAPTLDGIDLLAISFSQAEQLLRLKGGAITEDRDGAQSDTLGIGLWAPDGGEDPAAPCEAIIVFRRGYYDK
jgi:hypothetical protein